MAAFSFIRFYMVVLFSVCGFQAWKTIPVKGFFGMMGVFELTSPNKQTILEAFMKDGILQGVFLDQDKHGNQIVIPIQQPINTQKQKWYALTKIPLIMNMVTIFALSILQFLSDNKLNFMGAANTALLQDSQNRTYALFERDLPYEFNIDFDRYQITMGGRKSISGIYTFSGHSKKRSRNNTTVIDSMEYNMAKKTLTHHVLSGDLQCVLSKTEYPSKYYPIVHDFYMIGDDFSWVESPLTIHKNKKSKQGFGFAEGLWDIPIGLNRDLPTIFHVGNRSFVYEEGGLAIFHMAQIRVRDFAYYDIYASIYRELHFADDIRNLSGTYCLIRLDRQSGKATIVSNPELELYNLDFPVCFPGDKVILRNIDNETKRVNGFVVCDDQLGIVHKLLFRHFSILGESIVIGETPCVPPCVPPCLLFFAENIHTKSTYLMKWNVQDRHVEKILLPNETFCAGFHSLWISKN